MTDLAAVWRELPLDKPPYVLPEDLTALSEDPSRLVTLASFEAYIAECLQVHGDSRFHLGLLPQPWFGDLESATVFILMLNPGLNPGDYFSEYRVPSYRAALIDNLRQERGREFPLLFMNPELSWHPGARYFRGKLHWLVLALQNEKGMAYRDALAHVGKHVCVLQLVPYHSTVFRLSDTVFSRLQSSRLVKAFVAEMLRRRPEVLVLVTRKAEKWALPRRRNVVHYEGSETRAAHLSRNSRGGQELVRHFELRAS